MIIARRSTDSGLGFLVRHRLRPRRVARPLLVATAILTLLTVASRLAPEWVVSKLLDPDAEFRLPAAYDGLALLLAGAVGLLLPRLVYRLVGLGLIAMAFDEVFAVHEWLSRHDGRDWQILYVPVFVAAAVLLVLTFRCAHRDDRRALPFLAAGTAGWAAAQILEKLQWEGAVPQPGYMGMMLVEETLETFGSVCYLLGLLVLVWSRIDRPGGGLLMGSSRAERDA